KGLGKKKCTSTKLFDVKVKAKDSTLNEEEMAILNQTISADPVEKAKFCLTCRVKAALYDVDRGLKDDSHLFLGTDKHDKRNLELITSDHELKQLTRSCQSRQTKCHRRSISKPSSTTCWVWSRKRSRETRA
ncbi:chromodomain-helicase-DNA-binding protein 2-like, partial [Sceloporus undulatus]|uniref:chromodomain-helicase-DNA-binding protein 2-like n=1 Tax=Sceloporus undulatus TaxID=8520 RepID=UPI001C4C3D85